LGGDEFVILLRQEEIDVEDWVKTTAKQFEKITFNYEGQDLELGGSLGYEYSNIEVEGGEEVRDVFKRAEKACKEAKFRGNGEFVRWSSELEKSLPESTRKKCSICKATTTLFVRRCVREGDALSVCANCKCDLSSG